MSRGNYIGGNTVVGGRGRESGFSSYDPAEGVKTPAQKLKGAKRSTPKTYISEEKILDHLISQKLRGGENFTFPQNTEPKLKKLVNKRFLNPYEWAQHHQLFSDRYQKVSQKWERQKRTKVISQKSNISDETRLKKKVDQLQAKKNMLKNQIKEVDKQINQIQEILKNR